MNKIKNAIRTIPNFPIDGIMFRDVTTLYSNSEAMKEVIKLTCDYWRNEGLTSVAGIEARGFITGSIIANQLSLPFVPIRKKGKLPHDTLSQEYELEYGKATIEIHSDALNSNDKVLIVDDLIATGGTALASIELVKKLGANVNGCTFIIDLPELKGKEKIEEIGIKVQTLCSFEGH
jgi:adenine phosphoribosyltransferase